MELAKIVLTESNLINTKIISTGELDTVEVPDGSPVVVVAAVIESGRALEDLSRDLRSICSKSPIIYLVGLSKTSGKKRRTSLESTLIQTDKSSKHVYEELESLIVPPSENDHAWTREYELLCDEDFQLVLEGLTVATAYFQERKEFLRQSSTPSADNLFLCNNPGIKMRIQPGFVFWKPYDPDLVSHADVFFTVASILQKLRANSEAKLEKAKIINDWFKQTILSPRNFGRYSDGVIQASMLRAADPMELNYTADQVTSKEMRRTIIRIINSDDKSRGESAAEFMLAIATKRLRLDDLCLREVLKATPKTEIVKALLNFCKRKFANSQTLFER